MSDLADNLYKAITQETQNQLSLYQADKTISGEIFAIVNAVTGEYKVRYQDGIWSAFAQGKTKYRVGDNVLVKIPLGDFSKTKYIEGYTYNADMDTANDASSIEESFSPDWATIYGKDWSSENGLIAYSGINHKSSITIFEAASNEKHSVFQQYANRGTQFRVSGDFLTTLVNEQKKGNYGLRLTFVTFKEDSPEVTYTLDSTIFNGNPYQLSYWTPQTALFTVPKRYLAGLRKIEFFQEGFADYDPSGNTTNANLFCRNLKVEWIDVKDLTDTQYYLTIAAPQGMVFSNNFPTLTLTAKLMSGAESLMSKSTCFCFWYKEDPSVLVDTEDYEKAAGQGWRRIEKDAFDSIVVSKDDCPSAEINYKVVVIYNSSIILSKEITLVNIDNQYDFYLELVDDTTLELEDRKNEILTASGLWYIELPDTTRTRVGEVKSTSINLKEYFVYPWIKVFCEVYDGTTKLAVVQWTNYRSSNADEDLPNFILQYSGDDVFHYDANGDIFDVREYDDLEHTLKCTIATSQTDALTFTLKWLFVDKTPIGSSATNPTNSMMHSVWVDADNVLHFKAHTKFYEVFDNNSVYVRLTALDGTYIDYEKSIDFLKDGDQGTNGTTYVCLIRPIDSSGNKVFNKIGLNYNSGWNTIDALKFKVFVYCNGELITSGTNDFDISYTWNSKNVFLVPGASTAPYDNVAVRAMPRGGMVRQSENRNLLCRYTGDDGVTYTPEQLNEFYLKVQVDIKYKTEQKVSVYAYYPIDVYVGNIDKTKVEYTLPSYVKYSSSGTNPQYSNDPLSFTYDGTVGTVETNCAMLGIFSSLSNKYLMPAAHFTFDNNSIGMLKLTIDSSRYILHSVFMYLDPYENEALNSWDGTSLELDDNGGSILAPQIGAGEKNSSNQFTGVVMGKVSGQNGEVGLYGYKDGITTYSLKADGTASFGTKGQITIDGEKAQITGKNSGADDGQYMTINLVNLGKGTYAIQIGDKFLVDYEGNLICQNANVSGNINATSGTIGGCTIDAGNLTVPAANISGTVKAAEVITGNIKASQIEAGELNAGVVYSGTISGDQISAGTITAANIIAGNIIGNIAGQAPTYLNSSIISSSSKPLEKLYVEYLEATTGKFTTLSIRNAEDPQGTSLSIDGTKFMSGGVTIGGKTYLWTDIGGAAKFG